MKKPIKSRRKVGIPTKASGKKVIKNKPVVVKNKAGVTPLGDRVLIKPLGLEEGMVTSFGIVLPDSAKEKPEQGTVIAVGPGRRNEKGDYIPMGVKVGDRVYFKKPWDEPIKIGGVEYYVVSESDITLVQNQ